jgi:hypothetical protein
MSSQISSDCLQRFFEVISNNRFPFGSFVLRGCTLRAGAALDAADFLVVAGGDFRSVPWCVAGPAAE